MDQVTRKDSKRKSLVYASSAFLLGLEEMNMLIISIIDSFVGLPGYFCLGNHRKDYPPALED